MNKFSIICLLVLFISCKSPEPKKEVVEVKPRKEVIEKITPPIKVIDSSKLALNFKPLGTYSGIKSSIISDKAYFKSLYTQNPIKAIDSASTYIYSKLLNEIVPHWYNTPWDFNGHTNIPNQGEIACGYFVSTTLKHLGFNVNRYKMAQQGGMNEAKTLQKKSGLKIFSNLSFSKLKEQLNSVYAEGLYFVGLDNHVGYVLLKDKGVYFLHSSYYDNRVMIELAEASPCFISDIYVFAEITTNKELIRKWVFNEELVVPID